MSLESVFVSMYKKENGQHCNVSLTDSNAMKAYFAEVLPNYDRERVYVSNIKKVIAWYNQLIDHNLIDLEEKKSEEAEAPKTDAE